MAAADTVERLELLFQDAFEVGGAEVTKPKKEEVFGVPGAYILHDVLTAAESEALGNFVREAHARRIKEKALEGEKGRRDSQHHVPVHVTQPSLQCLADRLRPFLPVTAGPSNPASLAETGAEISTFLRCYQYCPGDSSRPHFDRPWSEHDDDGALAVFSAYSLLLYLNDSFEGGHTTFFEHDESIVSSCSGLTPKCDRDSLVTAASVAPCSRAVLLFPHGLRPGCHPNPLHEGSEVMTGEKLLIRTDVLFRMPRPSKPQRLLRQPKGDESEAAVTRARPIYFMEGCRTCYTGGQLGNGLERKASEAAQSKAPSSDAAAFLSAIDSFQKEQSGSMMHVGAVRGACLDAAVRARAPQTVLELGSYIGYSAVRIARLLPEGSKLWTVEPNMENADLATANVAHAGLAHIVTVLRGTIDDDSVRAELPSGALDFVFFDHRKALYRQTLEKLEGWGYVATGTVIAADNIGGHGARQHANAMDDEYARYVRESGMYVSCHSWGDGDGLEISEAVAIPGSFAAAEPKAITAAWAEEFTHAPPFSKTCDGRTAAARIQELRQEAKRAREAKRTARASRKSSGYAGTRAA
eukprot:TRINITY_DN75829_c0_g1_i1.p1 TRINITY_DN75829_c0_g1~~TRINITY_DN75829_c0_g1_i1.p1  ORF type:complete len:582 (-),score=120.31 TRINITY_DN75829_c0_g1_i1:19-1764(-)